MNLFPFKIESINVVNTGLDDVEVDGIEWIDHKRITIKNKVECVYDDGYGGTCVTLSDEFEWSFIKRDIYSDPYVLILLK